MADDFDDDRTAPRPPRRGSGASLTAVPPVVAASHQAEGSVVVLVPKVEAPAAEVPSLPSVDGSATTGEQHRRLPYQALLAESGLTTGPTRGRRRSGARILTAAVVLSASAVGGLVFKREVLDRRWSGDVADQAAAVERQRGLEFERAVDVEALPFDSYSTALAEHAFTEMAPDTRRTDDGSLATEQVASEWRALGLLEGALDISAVGRLAAEVRPAFYDPDHGRIALREGLSSSAAAFALSREMTLALTDQHFGWHTGLPGADPASRVGTIALFDGDALDTATVVAATSLDDVATQLAVNAADVPVGLAYAFDVVAGRAALAVAPRFAQPGVRSFAARDALVASPVRGDAAVVVADHVTATASPTFDTTVGHSLGMVAWYYALASRLPAEDAWNAVQGWNGDAVEHVDHDGASCIQARIWTRDAAAATVLYDAFSRWVATAPVESKAEVEMLATGYGVMVCSCDPGVDADIVTVASIAPVG